MIPNVDWNDFILSNCQLCVQPVDTTNVLGNRFFYKATSVEITLFKALSIIQKHPVTSPKKQKPQRERRSFFSFRW
jgi:hypothetical protein